MYTKFNEVYEKNKELDKMFDNEFKDDEIQKKNKLELLAEIGELANETRCFKYWSKKPVDRELLKYEYADCIIMTLYFFDIMHIDLDEDFMEITGDNQLDLFGRLYKLASEFYLNDDRKIIKEIFVTVLRLGTLLGFTIDETIEFCMNKIIKTIKSFKE